MYGKIQKWGNSQAIRLPKTVLEEAALYENDNVEIKVQEGSIVITPTNRRHKTLKERIAGYDGKYPSNEWDTGKPKGKEVW